jgi:hypothetical protein
MALYPFSTPDRRARRTPIGPRRASIASGDPAAPGSARIPVRVRSNHAGSVSISGQTPLTYSYLVV